MTDSDPQAAAATDQPSPPVDDLGDADDMPRASWWRSLPHVFPWLLGFIYWWASTRPYMLLLAGLPAILLAGLVGLGLLSRPFLSLDVMSERYKTAAWDALDAGRTDEARLCFEKLYQLGVMDERSEYRYATLLYEAGNKLESYERMSKLAPVDRTGFTPAHAFLARALMNNAFGFPLEKAQVLARGHLVAWGRAEPDDPEPQRLLGVLLHNMGEADEATEQLMKVADEQPEARLTLARVYRKTGKPNMAKEAAQQVIDQLRLQEASGKALTSRDLLLWTEAAGILEDYDQAEAVLQRGLARDPEDMMLRQAMGQLYFLRAHLLREHGLSRLADQLQYLEKALAANPRDVRVLARVAEITSLSDAQAERARELLSPLLAEGKAPALVHTILGSLAANQGNFERAQVHLEQACRLNPLGAVAMNNLAWLLSNIETPKLDRALQLANQAIDIEPSAGRFRETRGQILVKLERWSEAITDLEIALQELPELVEIHDALAKAYAALGDPQLAKVYRDKAQELRDKQPVEEMDDLEEVEDEEVENEEVDDSEAVEDEVEGEATEQEDNEEESANEDGTGEDGEGYKQRAVEESE
jgi:tetratricopeptide (TPR) repeat protein